LDGATGKMQVLRLRPSGSAQDDKFFVLRIELAVDGDAAYQMLASSAIPAVSAAMR
jgi:hypothetical protein